MNNQGRTNTQLLTDLRAPVARFYPFDLHTHSIGSHDVCVSHHYGNLPKSLRDAIAAVEAGASLPYAKDPVDHQQHDKDMATAHFVESFFDALRERRDALAIAENMPESDNWCVIAVTDHNTAHFAAMLSEYAWSKRAEDRLIVLPGIELEIHFPIEGQNDVCKIHMLCLFEPNTSASSIRGAINDARPVTTQHWDFGTEIKVDDLPRFIGKLRSHEQYPAACVAAHVWSSKGLQAEPKKLILGSIDAEITRLQGELARASVERDGTEERDIQALLKKAVSRKNDQDDLHFSILRLMGQCGLDGLQVRDQSHEAYYRRLHRFRENHGRSVPIVCSDSHTPSGILQSGDNIPYMKLDVATLSRGTSKAVFDEVRKRALRFGETRTTYSTPARVSYWIEGIEIVPDASDAREFWESPTSQSSSSGPRGTFTLPLSRNLNCFIGGRGSGKSSLIEAIAFLSDSSKFADEGLKKNEANREDWYRRADATLRGCRLRLVWKTTATTGIGALRRRALFVSRYFDPSGRHSDAEIRDLDGNAIVDESVKAPRVQLLRAHEIERMAHSDNLRVLFDSLCGANIAGLTASVEEIRMRLSKQRGVIVNLCKQISSVTKEGGPLRQYGIRKRLFEAVDKDELRERFQQVDQAEVITKATAATRTSWEEIEAPETLQQLEDDLTSFFDNTVTSVTDESGQVLEGHETLYSIVRPDAEPDDPSSRRDILAAIAIAKNAVTQGELHLATAEANAVAVLKGHRDELAKDGLPTGSGEREAKKKAFDDAKTDHQKYLSLVTQLNELLVERKALFEQLVEVSSQRTRVRESHAESLTKQLKRDLDGDVLRIEVRAKPLADRSEFASWMEKHLASAFTKFKQPRISALVNSALMPSALRELLLHEGNADTSALKISRAKAEDGRITDDESLKIVELNRAKRVVNLDEVDTWTPEFAASLPTDLQSGVVTFPSNQEVLCIDQVLSLDEVVLDDAPEILLNDRPLDSGSVPRPLRDLSPGQRCSAILPLLLLSGEYPLIIDQPEENLDNRLIRQVIVNILASIKLKRQVIIATHNPNLPVLGDAEQCVVLQASGRDLSRLVAVGSLDSPQVSRYITDIMEGGREAFQYRQSIYQTHWETEIDEIQTNT